MEPQIGRQLCVIELCEEVGGRGSWGVQLADGLRLMKWIMRGARVGFHAKKRKKKPERGRQTVTYYLLRPDLLEPNPHRETKEQPRPSLS